VTDQQIILKGRLNGIQRNRLKRLFDMLYSPRELAQEIGINKDQIYSVYVPLGCPYQRANNNRILINGKAFADWYVQTYPKTHLLQDETFCKTCKRPVKIHKPNKQVKGNLIYLLSECPDCGRRLTKIISYKP
jgi:hypothetical protein